MARRKNLKESDDPTPKIDVFIDIQTAICALNKRDLELIEYLFIREYSPDKVAAILKISTRQVRRRVSMLKKKVASILKSYQKRRD